MYTGAPPHTLIHTNTHTHTPAIPANTCNACHGAGSNAYAVIKAPTLPESLLLPGLCKQGPQGTYAFARGLGAFPSNKERERESEALVKCRKHNRDSVKQRKERKYCFFEFRAVTQAVVQLIATAKHFKKSC